MLNYFTALLLWIGLVLGGFLNYETLPPDIKGAIRPYIEGKEAIRAQEPQSTKRQERGCQNGKTRD